MDGIGFSNKDFAYIGLRCLVLILLFVRKPQDFFTDKNGKIYRNLRGEFLTVGEIEMHGFFVVA